MGFADEDLRCLTGADVAGTAAIGGDDFHSPANTSNGVVLR